MAEIIARVKEIEDTGVRYEIRRSSINEKSILPFKDAHAGQTAVITMTGPTLQRYERIPDAVHIGCNSIVHWGEVDYYFIMDLKGKTTFLQNKEAVVSYTPRRHRFFGTLVADSVPGVADDERIEVVAFSHLRFCPPGDVGQYCFGLPRSTAFVCLQFALYIGCTNIILVGCDCEKTGSFNQPTPYCYDRLIGDWRFIAKWIAHLYPQVRMRCLRPRGLKGIVDEYVLADGGEERRDLNRR